jgi:hypothetical protein
MDRFGNKSMTSTLAAVRTSKTHWKSVKWRLVDGACEKSLNCANRSRDYVWFEIGLKVMNEDRLAFSAMSHSDSGMRIRQPSHIDAPHFRKAEEVITWHFITLQVNSFRLEAKS